MQLKTTRLSDQTISFDTSVGSVVDLDAKLSVEQLYEIYKNLLAEASKKTTEST